MYTCAFLGCGPRARAHARVYGSVPRGRLTACCDLNAERLHAFGDEFGIARRYTDVDEMLERERPDLLHIVTVPSLRVDLMRTAANHGVPVVIVEKPIALWGEDWRDITTIRDQAETRFVVNTQLHFHARNLELKDDVAAGRIGEIRCIDVSARSTPLDQGVHVLELAHSYTGFRPFLSVFGQVSGADMLDSRQPSPAMAEASLMSADNIHTVMVCGPCAPRATASDSVYHHKRISVYGTRGFVQWTMGGWERLTPERGYEYGSHDYTTEDDAAQARLTEACFDWLEDDGAAHPTRLERNLAQFNAILGLYHSALTHAPVELPCAPPDGLAQALRERLRAMASSSSRPAG